MEPAESPSRFEHLDPPVSGPEAIGGAPPATATFRAELEEMLEKTARTCMPFGKYGPQTFPPEGVPLYDLPVEYLHWFSAVGFPAGKLGSLMSFVYQLKCDGSDSVFDRFRKANGGRHPLRKKRQRSFDFD